MATAFAFKRLTRSEIPAGFSPHGKDLIMMAMEAGGLARISSKGHVIIRNEAGQTTAMSQNTGNGHKRIGNAAADIKRLFPKLEVEEEKETSVDEKMCSKCKEHKPRSEYHVNLRHKDGLQSWCKDCTKIASRESYERKKAREEAKAKTPVQHGVELAEAARDRRETASPAPTAQLPQPQAASAWEAIQQMVSAELHAEVSQLREENARLRGLIAAAKEALG